MTCDVFLKEKRSRKTEKDDLDTRMKNPLTFIRKRIFKIIALSGPAVKAQETENCGGKISHSLSAENPAKGYAHQNSNYSFSASLILVSNSSTLLLDGWSGTNSLSARCRFSLALSGSPSYQL